MIHVLQTQNSHSGTHNDNIEVFVDSYGSFFPSTLVEIRIHLFYVFMKPLQSFIH